MTKPTSDNTEYLPPRYFLCSIKSRLYFLDNENRILFFSLEIIIIFFAFFIIFKEIKLAKVSIVFPDFYNNE